ncbi:gag-pol polyprotein [Tanacetum coccineum]
MTTKQTLTFKLKMKSISVILTGMEMKFTQQLMHATQLKAMGQPSESYNRILLSESTKPQRSNGTIIHASSFHTTKCDYQTQRQRRDRQTSYSSICLFREDSDPEQASEDKRYEKRTWHSLLSISRSCKTYQQTTFELFKTPGTRLKRPHQVQQNGIQCFNCKGFGHYAKECRKPKRVKDYAYHKEKMMLCKQAEKGVPLQADWLEDTDEEINEQELEAHYSYMAKIQDVSPEESSSTGQPLEKKDDSNVTPDSSNICTNDNQVDQNAGECVAERAALANLISNLTLDTEENKTGRLLAVGIVL